jgi:hypothetical protein
MTSATQRIGASTITPALAVAAFASIGAGAIHAAAIGVHSEHRQAVIAFAVVGLAQLAWGVVALTRSGSARVLALVGAGINLAAFGGWVLAKTNGISFIDGLETSETPQFADTAAATFAAVAVIGAVLAATLWRDAATWFGTLSFSGVALATAGVTMFGMVSAGTHTHAHGTANTAAAHTHAPGTASSGPPAVVPPKPYDPTKPIDLGGVPGVTLEQQARAENLIAITLARLPKYSDYHKAEADGFTSIGDAVTGDEHFIKLSYFKDSHILDPDYPESLVYKPQPDGSKQLAAAMYMLNPGTRLTDVPDVGGALTQWHIHNNLCFTSEGKVAGLRANGGPCPPPLNPGVDSPMLHVWIQPHPCGPFAALEGVGAGQIKPGEERLCDHVHGA